MFSGYHYSYLSCSFTIFLMVIAPSFSFPSTVACSTSSTSAASIRIPLSRVDSSVDHFVLVFIVLLPYSFVSLSPIFYPSLQLLTWSRELLLSLAAVDVFKRCLRRIRHSEFPPCFTVSYCLLFSLAILDLSGARPRRLLRLLIHGSFGTDVLGTSYLLPITMMMAL